MCGRSLRCKGKLRVILIVASCGQVSGQHPRLFNQGMSG